MAVIISQEELAYLVRLQGYTELRGTSLNLADGDETLEAALLGAAERTLRARGWLVFDGDTLNLEQTVAGLIAFAVNAPYAFAVRRALTGGTQQGTMYYLSDDLQLTHHGDNGVHVFDTLDIPTSQAILEAMHGGDPVHDTPREPILDIPAAALVAAAAATQEAGLSDADRLSALTDNGIDAALATTLLTFYRENWLATVTLGSWSPAENAFAYSALTFIQSRTGWWVLTPARGENDVSLQPISSDDLAALVNEAVDTAIPAA